MNLSDIIALAKQGYKPSDIKELLALANEQEKKQPDPQTDPAPNTPTEPPAETARDQESGAAEKLPDEAEAKTETNTPDPQIEDLKRQIADLQAANARRGQPDQKSNDEILQEMVKGFI